MSTHPRAGRFFLASCIALIVTSMSFAIRAEIMPALGREFALSPVEIGWITGMAFWGFTLSMVFGGPLCDVVGMGRLASLAFVGHAAGILLTIFAQGFWSLFFATLLVGVGNGFVEAACNPLIATLYPDDKTTKLNQFHVWFPGGIVIGGLLAYALENAGLNWQVKMAAMLPATAVYGAMFLGMKFPRTERAESGVSNREMFGEIFRPLFLFMAACMLLTAATELGTNQWMVVLLENVGVPAILVLVWINGLMAIGRQFAGPVVHRLAPAGMLLFSAVFAAIGLYWLSYASGYATFAAAAVFAVGICYFWPTMLGFVAEYTPKSGALGLAVMGGIGNVSASLAQPLLGRIYESNLVARLPEGASIDALREAAAGTAAHQQWIATTAAAGSDSLRAVVVLPLALIVAFTALYVRQKGKRPEKLRRAPLGA